MAISLPAIIAYSFVASAIVGLCFSFLTDRVSVKVGLLSAVSTTTGQVVVRML
jgi:hypothetical protein